MVIDFNTSNSAGRSAQSSAASAKRDATEAARPAEQTAADQAVSAESGVKLSSQAQQIEERIRDLPEVDSARVAQIRQAISDGSYQTDSARIADKLLALEE